MFPARRGAEVAVPVAGHAGACEPDEVGIGADEGRETPGELLRKRLINLLDSLDDLFADEALDERRAPRLGTIG